MSSQRRPSKGDSDNELSLEQRLVMQLSAAIHHDGDNHIETSPRTDQVPRASDSHTEISKSDLPGYSGDLVSSLGSILGVQSQANAPLDQQNAFVQNNATSSNNLNNMDLSQLNLSNFNFGNLNLGNINLGNLGDLGAKSTAKSTHSKDISAPAQSSSSVSAKELLQQKAVQPDHSEHSSIPPTTSIDPEVTSIQSILQSLLTGGLSTEDSGYSNQSTQTVPQANPLPTSEASSSHQPHNQENAFSSAPEPAGFNNLYNLGLGLEDQSLIESLRSAISIPTDSKSMDKTTAEKHVRPTMTADNIQKSRTSVPSKSKRSKVQSYKVGPSLTSQSEFNASDPDTLRAIQQALLSALGPSASSTSLADSLTSSHAASGVASALEPTLPGALPFSQPPIIPTPSHKTQESAKASGFLPELSSSVPKSSAARHIEPSIPSTGEPRIGKSPARKPLPKIAKSVEVDKQKLKEGNAARKRKWREVNLVQNKDNDLRVRIIKRANELYGDSESAKKSEWIDEEFEKRRQRRILRAGINSIVDAAKARAAKAAELGETDKTPLDYARMHISEQTRTLTQQSKQAAKSHLSQLFRSSNAALEPQLHNEQVTIPVAPYMLVASPKRPPYNFSWLSKDKPENSHVSQKQDSQPQDTEPKPSEVNVSEPQRADVNASETKSSGAKAADTEGVEKSLEKENPLEPKKAENEKALEGNGSTLQSHLAKDHERDSGQRDVSSPSSSTHVTKDSTCANNKECYSDPRPKHRYTMIGNIKLGLPPNLTALYHKIRGTTPLEHRAENVPKHSSTHDI